MTRPVPRNIDRPNRTAEYVVTFMFVYYSLMFLTHEPMFAIFMGGLAVYVVYKLTLNKPEGMAYRVWYSKFGIGKMIPPPKKVAIFQLGVIDKN